MALEKKNYYRCPRCQELGHPCAVHQPTKVEPGDREPELDYQMHACPDCGRLHEDARF
jgi:predicted RNA-binding Zn-ribbon protein involved in translation (DUF1610 family)